MYRAEGDRVFCDHKYICTISPPEDSDETRLEGENWLDMRERTQTDRDKLEEVSKAMATCVAKALNEEFT
ncbi:hypothetical protein KAR91_36220 [Candidatus Pacearchaeota archaeon]|nr:hypothetical protein [Candidatus Pacearchaeota archaeon]